MVWHLWQYGNHSRQYGDNSWQYGDNLWQYGDNSWQYCDNSWQYCDNDTLRFPFLADRLQTMQHLISNRSPKQNFAKSGKTFRKTLMEKVMSVSGEQVLIHPDHLFGTSFSQSYCLILGNFTLFQNNECLFFLTRHDSCQCFPLCCKELF